MTKRSNPSQSTARRCVCLTLSAASLACATHASAITIDFDYRFDRGFFTDSNGAPIAERRSALETAAKPYTQFLDHLAAIDPSGSNSWSATFLHPSWSSFSETVTVKNEAIAADTLKIFVGGSASGGDVLGMAQSGTVQVTGSSEFKDLVDARGQSGALAQRPTDFGPWGGSVWFNSNIPWYFSSGAAGLDSMHNDFITTATHELGHILGFGDAKSWRDQVVMQAGTNEFTGAHATAVYGTPVPVDMVGAHWDLNVMGHVNGKEQNTLMDPSTAVGVRELMTDVDLAGFQDIGWQLSAAAVPEPNTWLALLSGLSALTLGNWARSRRHRATLARAQRS